MGGSTKPTLLVLRHHGLGDLVTAQPSLHGLRRSFPRHRLVVTCPSWLVPLAEFFGTADQLVSEIPSQQSGCDNGGDPTCHQQIDAALLANVLTNIRSADVLVSLRTPGSELVPLINTLMPRVFVSYRYDGIAATENSPELNFTEHILTRWRRLLKTICVEPCDDDLYTTLAVPLSHQGFTVVHIGAGSPSRLWPINRWVKVVLHLQSTGHRIALTGSGPEAAMVNEVRRRACLPAECNRCGTDVQELTWLVAGARLVASVDTGISHLATSFRRPAVTLFGPVSPAWWGPPPGNAQHKTLWAGKSGDNYGAATDLGLLRIKVEDVIEAIKEMCC
ncbi:MAG: glycosyltransferase family 9 protein [Desulfatitalea sp.]|nr:glycosyltransferase family 9 protein [Desulfatitalea sp.]NNJ99528.1 glycosyltransferase family 9 protein [Desulfatitalea sp.]